MWLGINYVILANHMISLITSSRTDPWYFKTFDFENIRKKKVRKKNRGKQVREKSTVGKRRGKSTGKNVRETQVREKSKKKKVREKSAINSRYSWNIDESGAKQHNPNLI